MSLTPLHVDHAVEQEAWDSLERNRRFENPWMRWFEDGFERWLGNFFPGAFGIPYGRASVEMQLRERLDFPSAEWEAAGLCPEFAQRVLETLSEPLEHPTNHLAPQDPVHLAMLEGSDELWNMTTLLLLKRKFGIAYSNEDFGRLFLAEATIGDFVRDVATLHRNKKPEQNDRGFFRWWAPAFPSAPTTKSPSSPPVRGD